MSSDDSIREKLDEVYKKLGGGAYIPPSILSVWDNDYDLASISLKSRIVDACGGVNAPLEKDCTIMGESYCAGETAMHVVARKGYVKMAQLLCDHGATVTPQRSKGAAPIHLAVKYGHEKFLEYILEQVKNNEFAPTFDLDMKIEPGEALVIGTGDGYTTSFREDEILISGRNFKGRYLDILRLLAKKRKELPEVRIKYIDEGENGSYEYLAPRATITGFTTDMGTILGDYGGAVKKTKFNAAVGYAANAGRNPLLIAAENNNLAMVKMLIDAGASPDAYFEFHSQTPLCMAVAHGNVEMVRILLEAGANSCTLCPSPEKQKTERWLDTPLLKAISKKLKNIVELMLPYLKPGDISLGNDIVTPLFLAMEVQSNDIVELLLKNRANLFHVGRNTPASGKPMHVAYATTEERLERLKEKDDREHWGWSALIKAAVVGNLGILKMLIKYAKKRIDASNNETEKKLYNDEQRAFYEKYRNRYYGPVTSPHRLQAHYDKMVSNYSAFINFQDREYEYSALHYAVYHCHYGVTEFLCKNQADIDLTTADKVSLKYRENDEEHNYPVDGDTPLILAIKRLHDFSNSKNESDRGRYKNLEKIIKCLIRFKADVSKEDKYGKNALYYLRHWEFEDLYKYAEKKLKKE